MYTYESSFCGIKKEFNFKNAGPEAIITGFISGQHKKSIGSGPFCMESGVTKYLNIIFSSSSIISFLLSSMHITLYLALIVIVWYNSAVGKSRISTVCIIRSYPSGIISSLIVFGWKVIANTT